MSQNSLHRNNNSTAKKTPPVQFDDQFSQDEMMVMNLLMRNRIMSAPVTTTRIGKYFDIVIGLGKDEVAVLTIHEDGMKYLGLTQHE